MSAELERSREKALLRREALVAKAKAQGVRGPITQIMEPGETAAIQPLLEFEPDINNIPICPIEEPPTPPPAARRTPRAVEQRPTSTNFQLPTTDLLNEAAAAALTTSRNSKRRGAHQIEVRRVQRAGLGGADQSRAGGDHFRIQARSRHQVQPHHHAHRRPVPGLAGRIHPDRAHSRQTHRGHRGAQFAARADQPARRCSNPTSSRSRTRGLTISLGKDINGRIKVAALETMPHLLIAGSTGSGKSVMINSMIMSILYKSTPDDVRMIMVDPKRARAGHVRRHPAPADAGDHRSKKATNALRNAVLEMERRLRLLAEQGVRNIDQYNKKIRKLQAGAAQPVRGRRRQRKNCAAALHSDPDRRVGRPDDAGRPQRGGVASRAWRRWRAPWACTWCWPRSGPAWT